MAYDEKLAARTRAVLTPLAAFDEKKMFGGLAFMVRGHMCCGVLQDRLMVRCDPKSYDRFVAEPGASPMDFTGRPMRGFLFVSGAGVAAAPALRRWIGRALEFVERQPAKPAAKPPKKAVTKVKANTRR
jgi:TfoX/Sxy family transcriptional regulator of competence genes